MSSERILDFILQRPNAHGRKSFAIIRRQGKTNKTLTIPELQIINKQIKEGKLDLVTASEMAEDIRAKLYRDFKYTRNYNPDNKRLFNEYWNKTYRNRKIKDRTAAYNRINRAIKALEELSLLSATQEQIQDKISKMKQQRRIATTLEQLLKFFGRSEVSLFKDKKKRVDPRYLTATELEKMLSHIQCEDVSHMKMLCRVAFATGMRLGEIYGLEEHHIRSKNTVAYVERQMMLDLSFDETKTGSARLVPILPKYRKEVVNWVTKVDIEMRKKTRNWQHADIVKQACLRAFPTKPDKHLVFRDLRHCYAIEMLNLEFSLTQVAQCLGNSWQVCQEYYSGHHLTNENVNAIVMQLNRKKA